MDGLKKVSLRYHLTNKVSLRYIIIIAFVGSAILGSWKIWGDRINLEFDLKKLNDISNNFLFESNIDSVSYAIGVLVGSNNLKQLETAPGGEDINKEAMAAAFRASSLGEEVITKEQAQAIVQKFFEGAGEREAQKSLEEGNAFLEKNKSREGVTTTASGLQYEILTAGTGALPTAADQVRVNYHGTLINGKVFDSSVDRGEPAVFGVGQVIPGWTEALQLMPVGSKWKIYLPAQIAYGERGAGGDIGPNATLIFEVELLEIIKTE